MGCLFLLWSMLLCRRCETEAIHRFGVEAFVASGRKQVAFSKIPPSIENDKTAGCRGSRLEATRPRRLSDNAEGPLYINDKCINCSACSMFAPSVFAREAKRDTH